MTAKTRILVSLAWFVLVIAIGVGGVFWIQSDTSDSQERTRRAGILGTGLGCLGGIGLGVLWMPYAYRLGRKKRAEREQAAGKQSDNNRRTGKKLSAGRKGRKGRKGKVGSRSRGRRK